VGILATDAVVTGGTASYSAGEQKVGLLYKRSLGTVVRARIVLQLNDNDFAGRPPLEVVLRTTLNGATHDLVILVLHMKAFSDPESWQRRVNASAALKEYLDTTWPAQRVLVVGDWNDDLDTSITARSPSPYANFVADVSRYTFPTIALSVARIRTTVGFSEAVDHHLASNELAALYVPGSARAVALDQAIPNYGQVTSDHYPVVSSYAWR
jgi:endonuclease/exonuclease/phosphatase family metal-dependent hydrolase